VVHGGEKFSDAALVTPGVRAAIQACIAIAPLHNPPNLAGIAACESIFPGLPQVAVFDTAFHQTMPPHVFLYGLPYEQYEKFHIRKYGFHGTSHEFVARRCAQLLKRTSIRSDSSPVTWATVPALPRLRTAAPLTPRWASRRSKA